MKRREFFRQSAGLLGLPLISSLSNISEQANVKKPNIVLILADDLGYGELGCYGQRVIETPHIDRLAASGKMFTQHYSGSPVCAPSRCTLLTGKHTGHAQIRGNDEWGSRGEVWNFEKMAKDPNLEGQRPMVKDTVTIAGLLRTIGYRTACIGKWGLGAPLSDGAPNRQGFDFFFGYNCQRQAHTYYPTHLWKNHKKVMLNNKLVIPHQKRQIDNPNAPESYADFNQRDYAPDLMEKEALKFIERNKKGPFFLYFASPLPHLALQAPKPYVDRYRRILGNEKPYIGKSYFPCQYPRATYAAMITYLDDQVGKIVKKLKDTGVYENTLVIFTSDNGPTYTGGADTVFFNSGGIFGEKYGRGKGFLHEGGIRVPLIASWPGKIAAGTKSDHISAFWDLLPTLGQAAGVTLPRGIDGISFLPQLTGKGRQLIHPYLYWEFPGYQGQQAVRLGKWKGIRKNIQKGNLKIQLFDLEKDPGETMDLAQKYPRVVDQIRKIMIREHTESPIKRFKMTALGDGRK